MSTTIDETALHHDYGLEHDADDRPDGLGAYSGGMAKLRRPDPTLSIAAGQGWAGELDD